MGVTGISVRELRLSLHHAHGLIVQAAKANAIKMARVPRIAADPQSPWTHRSGETPARPRERDPAWTLFFRAGYKLDMARKAIRTADFCLAKLDDEQPELPPIPSLRRRRK